MRSDRRLEGGSITTSVRSGRWSRADGWRTPAGVPVNGVGFLRPSSIAWNGTRFLAVDGFRVNAISADGVVETSIEVPHVDWIACRTNCIAVRGSDVTRLGPDGQPLDGEPPDLFVAISAPPLVFEHVDIPGFAYVYVDGARQVWAAMFDADGVLRELVEISDDDHLAGDTLAPIKAVVVDGTLVVVWHGDFFTYNRTIAADGTKGEFRTTPEWGRGTFAPLGRGLLSVWYDYAAQTFRGARLDTDLQYLDAPFDLLPAPVAPLEYGLPTIASTGTSALVGFTWLDPDLDVARIALVPLHLE